MAEGFFKQLPAKCEMLKAESCKMVTFEWSLSLWVRALLAPDLEGPCTMIKPITELARSSARCG
jgi:hypothetical protein